LNQL